MQSHFYLPHFRNMEIEKKIKYFTQTKNGLLFNEVLMYKYYFKRFFTLFSYYLLQVFLSSLDLLTVIFQTKNNAAYLATNALEIVALENVNQLWILYVKLILSFYYLSMSLPETLLLRNFLYLFSVVCSYISCMTYVWSSVLGEYKKVG